MGIGVGLSEILNSQRSNLRGKQVEKARRGRHTNKQYLRCIFCGKPRGKLFEKMETKMDDKKDAKRYRWLKKHTYVQQADGGMVEWYSLPNVDKSSVSTFMGVKPYNYQSLDAAIDAEMEKK
jgi:hypothetical protein